MITFSDYYPIRTEYEGVKKLVLGAGKFVCHSTSPQLAMLLGPGAMNLCFEHHRIAREGLQQLKEGVTLLRHSPITFIALGYLGGMLHCYLRT